MCIRSLVYEMRQCSFTFIITSSSILIGTSDLCDQRATIFCCFINISAQTIK